MTLCEVLPSPRPDPWMRDCQPPEPSRALYYASMQMGTGYIPVFIPFHWCISWKDLGDFNLLFVPVQVRIRIAFLFSYFDPFIRVKCHSPPRFIFNNVSECTGTRPNIEIPIIWPSCSNSPWIGEVHLLDGWRQACTITWIFGAQSSKVHSIRHSLLLFKSPSLRPSHLHRVRLTSRFQDGHSKHLFNNSQTYT